MTTARQYGQMMRQEGVLWPAPAIDENDMRADGAKIYTIGRRKLTDVLVLARRGWGTVYAAPSYAGYRAAFDNAMPSISTGRDVDHLLPKSQAPIGDYLALGRISEASNRGWNDDDSTQGMAQKVYNMRVANPHSFTSQLTDLERGWAVVTCYIRPLPEMNLAMLEEVGTADLDAAFGG